MKILIAIVTLLVTSPAAAQSLAIEHATVYTEPGKRIEDATVIIEAGIISAVGRGVPVPAGATRIDASGKIVTAGFVEASTNIGLSEVDSVASTREGRFTNSDDVIHAAYRVIDGFNPTSVAVPLARTGGVTSAVSTPTGGLVSGSSAWIAMRSDDPMAMIVKAPLAMYASLGESAKASADGSRGLAVERLREVLDDARQYQRRRQQYERNQTRAFAAERLDLEALIPVVRGQLPLVIRANKSSDILAALRIGREMGARVVIEGGAEAWRVADQLARENVAVILDPLANLPATFDRIQVQDDAARRLAAAGVTIALSTLGDGSNARTLRQLAGNAIARGLPADAALASVTTAPAAIFGLRDRGRVARGQVADLVIWSGDPFELGSRAETVLVAGVQQPTQTRQQRLFERYRKLPHKQ